MQSLARTERTEVTWQPVFSYVFGYAVSVDGGFQAVYPIDPGKLILRLEVRPYRDFPVIEYTPWFENPGDAPSEIISDFLPLDLAGEQPDTLGAMRIKDWCARQLHAPEKGEGFILAKPPASTICAPFIRG